MVFKEELLPLRLDEQRSKRNELLSYLYKNTNSMRTCTTQQALLLPVASNFFSYLNKNKNTRAREVRGHSE